MRLPFTTDQFVEVLRRYNEAVWPVQWALLILGLCAVALAVRAGATGRRAVFAILSALWLWMGLAYHLAFFRAINPAATLFAAAFVAQAGLLLWIGAWRGRIAFRVAPDAPGAIGAALVAYALIGYPALGYALGHRYPESPTFGLPCPTTLLTLGLLAWTRPSSPWLLAVPVAWAATGTAAAARLGMREDYGLAVAAGLVLVVRALAWWRERPARSHPRAEAVVRSVVGPRP